MQTPRDPKAPWVQIESSFYPETPIIRIKTSAFQHKKMILFGTYIFYFRLFSC
jgi:hypothetical protein